MWTRHHRGSSPRRLRRVAIALIVVLGSVLRVPAEGSRLANLHQGARAAALQPSARQLEACREVAAALNPKGLYLLGLDFIGEHLTEVNFTSPTTIVQVNQVNGIRADKVLVDELERMWRERQKGEPSPGDLPQSSGAAGLGGHRGLPQPGLRR